MDSTTDELLLSFGLPAAIYQTEIQILPLLGVPMTTLRLRDSLEGLTGPRSCFIYDCYIL